MSRAQNPLDCLLKLPQVSATFRGLVWKRWLVGEATPGEGDHQREEGRHPDGRTRVWKGPPGQPREGEGVWRTWVLAEALRTDLLPGYTLLFRGVVPAQPDLPPPFLPHGDNARMICVGNHYLDY